MRRIFGLGLLCAGCFEASAPSPESPAAPPAAAAAPAPTEAPQGGPVSGPVFHAIGQEPGWTVDVTSERGVDALVYVGDYGSVTLTFPAAARAADNAHTSWTATIEGHAISVAAEHKPCADAMSGKPFPAVVRVQIDGRTLDGCGGAVP